MINARIKNLVKKIVFCMDTFFVSVFTTVSVHAEGMNPWDALSKHSKLEEASAASEGTTQVAVALYRIFQRVGIYGCIITTLVALAMMALRWGDPRVQSENKSKVIMKFVVCFVICAASWFLGLVLEIVKTSAGYN